MNAIPRRARHVIAVAAGSAAIALVTLTPAAAVTTNTSIATITTRPTATTSRGSTPTTIIVRVDSSDGWTHTWLPILLSVIVPAAIAVGVARHTDGGAQRRATAEQTRYRASRDADWVREATARCVKAARDWLTAIDQVSGSTATAVEEANKTRAFVRETEAKVPEAREQFDTAVAAKEQHITQHGSNRQSLEFAASGAQRHLSDLLTDVAESEQRFEVLAGSVQVLADTALVPLRNEWEQAQALAELLDPFAYSDVRAIHRALTKADQALLVPRDNFDNARQQAEIAVRQFVDNAKARVRKLTDGKTSTT